MAFIFRTTTVSSHFINNIIDWITIGDPCIKYFQNVVLIGRRNKVIVWCLMTATMDHNDGGSDTPRQLRVFLYKNVTDRQEDTFLPSTHMCCKRFTDYCYNTY